MISIISLSLIFCYIEIVLYDLLYRYDYFGDDEADQQGDGDDVHRFVFIGLGNKVFVIFVGIREIEFYLLYMWQYRYIKLYTHGIGYGKYGSGSTDVNGDLQTTIGQLLCKIVHRLIQQQYLYRSKSILPGYLCKVYTSHYLYEGTAIAFL